MISIYDFVFKENLLTPGECQLALEELEDLNWQIHTWSKNSKDGKYKTFEIPANSELSISWGKSGSNLEYILKQSIDKAISMYGEKFNHGVLNYTRPRLNKYAKNTKMEQHVDHIHTIFDGKIRGIPIISIVGILNDDYDGGEFIFNNDYKVDLKAGDVLIFPSVFIYKHRVNPVTNGTRFSYVSWGY